jgi:hypothetical protein
MAKIKAKKMGTPGTKPTGLSVSFFYLSPETSLHNDFTLLLVSHLNNRPQPLF